MAVRVVQGHVLDVLAGERAGSVHTVCTSPPYWQARDYGTPPQVWPDGWVGELGREPVPEDYIRHLVDVFRAVKRVLRDDGSCFVNLGDSYWSDPGGQNGTTGNVSARAITANTQAGRQDRTSVKHARLKPGDLVGIPWAFAFALQADGWVLRSAVTWIKTSPMPESISGSRWERCKVKTAEGKSPARNLKPELGRGLVGGVGTLEHAEWADCPGCAKCAATDGLVLRRGSGRPTNATEMLFLFTKGMGTYFYDLEATREPLSPNSWNTGGSWRGGTKPRPTGAPPGANNPGTYDRSVTEMYNPAGRNAWNWMTFKPAPSSLEHYAGYPPALPEFCIKAGTSERGVCPGCGAPWARVIQTTRLAPAPPSGWREATGRFNPRVDNDPVGGRTESSTLGWRQTCACPPHQPVPARVLDCFGGSGTTGMVADRLGRDAVLVELRSEYAQMAQRRLVGDSPLFADVTLEGAAAAPPVEAAPSDPRTKQERYPNRTVAGFNQRWKASHPKLPLEPPVEAAG